MSPPDDHHRYIEYLQHNLLKPGWEIVYNQKSWATWIASNSSRLRKIAASQFASDQDSPVRYLEKLTREFEPNTQFEVLHTKEIFDPILEDVRRGAEAIGLKPIGEIQIATSTDISASPLARPSTHPHLLFIGPGTSSFCNYWAKAFTAVARAIARTHGPTPVTSADELEAVFEADRSDVQLVGRLALHYAVFGTLIGFGQVVQPSAYLAYRLELLRAMETFAVAHEYAHCLAHERLLEFRGTSEQPPEHQLEFFCDEVGLAISRDCANRVESFLGFAGIGPLVFFRAIELCESVRTAVSRCATESSLRPLRLDSLSHPSLGDRIQAIKSYVAYRTPEDQRQTVQQFVEEYDLIATSTSSIINKAVRTALAGSMQN